MLINNTNNTTGLCVQYGYELNNRISLVCVLTFFAMKALFFLQASLPVHRSFCWLVDNRFSASLCKIKSVLVIIYVISPIYYKMQCFGSPQLAGFSRLPPASPEACYVYFMRVQQTASPAPVFGPCCKAGD